MLQGRSLSQYGGPVKTAAPTAPILPVSPEQLAEQQNPAIATNWEALKQVGQIGLMGLSLGAGTKALLGIRDLFSRPSFAPPKIGPRPSVIEVNVPEEQEEQEEQRKSRRKMAADQPPAPGVLLDPVETPSGTVQPPIPPGPIPPSGWMSYLAGLSSTGIKDKPLFFPGAVGAGMLGIYGGWKGVGAISDWHHDLARKRELEDAKREYRNALVEQYNSDKRAADNVAGVLDELAGRMVKTAFSGGEALGSYLTLAGLLAAGSGMATYNYVKSRTPENRLAKAIKQRERLRWASRAPEIYAVSKPTPVPTPTTALQDEDAEASDQDEMRARMPPNIRKLASLYKG